MVRRLKKSTISVILVASTIYDVNVRIGKAWAAVNGMKNIWKSNLPDQLKRNFFRATVESVLAYGSVPWTLTAALEKQLNGTYTSSHYGDQKSARN